MFHIKFCRFKDVYTVTLFTKLNNVAVHKIKSNSKIDEIYGLEVERMLYYSLLMVLPNV